MEDPHRGPALARAKELVASFRTIQPTSEAVFGAFAELDALPEDVVREALAGTGDLPDLDRLDDATRKVHGLPPRSLRLATAHVARGADILDAGSVAEEQVRIAGMSWDGADLPAEERLDGERADSLATTLERRTLVDPRERPAAPLYDAVLYASDCGVVFRAGTTDLVAFVAYGRVEARERHVRAALQAALTSREMAPVEVRTALAAPAAAKVPSATGDKPGIKKAAAATPRAAKTAAGAARVSTEEGASAREVPAKKAASAKKTITGKANSAATKKAMGKKVVSAEKAAPAKKTSSTKKALAKKTSPAKKAPAKKTSSTKKALAKKTSPAKKAVAKKALSAAAKKAASAAATRKTATRKAASASSARKPSSKKTATSAKKTAARKAASAAKTSSAKKAAKRAAPQATGKTPAKRPGKKAPGSARAKGRGRAR